MAANFSATPVAGTAPITAIFTDLSDGVPVAWEWNFEYGPIQRVQNPSLTVYAPGSYTVTLTVTYADNSTATVTKPAFLVVDQPTNLYPSYSVPYTAKISAVPPPSANTAIQFDVWIPNDLNPGGLNLSTLVYGAQGLTSVSVSRVLTNIIDPSLVTAGLAPPELILGEQYRVTATYTAGAAFGALTFPTQSTPQYTTFVNPWDPVAHILDRCCAVFGLLVGGSAPSMSIPIDHSRAIVNCSIPIPRSYFGSPATTPTTSSDILALPGTSLVTGNNPDVDNFGVPSVGGALASFVVPTPQTASRIVFAYPASSRNVASILNQQLAGYELKGNFTKTTIMLAAVGDVPAQLYNVYTYVPIEPFPLSNTGYYSVFI